MIERGQYVGLGTSASTLEGRDTNYLHSSRRQTECHYSHIGDILIANEASRQRKRRLQMAPGRLGTAPAARKASFGIPSFVAPSGLDLASFPTFGAARSPTASHASDRLTHFSLFENKQHPFSNYWTSGGGLSEVVGVLPSKEQADLLVAKYFDALDPIYPIVSRHEFMTEYERFWSLSLEAKCESDPAQIALQFVVYACATLYIDRISPDERMSTGEFYVSASHQALCLSSYLNSCSASTMQTMILMCHFLISSSHISDAWTFSGMTQRQAYGMDLNRNPDSVRPDDSFLEKQQRCKLWQATMFQDTSLSLFLELPPATLYYDIEPNYLRHQSSTSPVSFTRDLSTAPDDVIDIAYLRAMWEYTAFAQTRLCVPKSLKRSVSNDAAHKANMISEYRQMFKAWPYPFNSEKSNRFDGWSRRLLRQLISLSSNYFWLLMVLHMDKDESKGIENDVHETLEACHEGLAAFFALVRLDPIQADCWSAHHTRAFSQAVSQTERLSHMH